MLFRRRTPLSIAEKVRVSVWPRRSWRRSVRYFLKRVVRLDATAHAVAAGVAAGVFASMTPFLGFHVILAFVLAFLIGGNMLAAAIGTVAGNPLTFPFIWLTTYETGSFILGRAGHDISLPDLSRSLTTESFAEMIPILKPMLVGSLPVGLAVGLGIYALTRLLVQAYQTRRRDRLTERPRIAPGPAAAEEGARGHDPA